MGALLVCFEGRDTCWLATLALEEASHLRGVGGDKERASAVEDDSIDRRSGRPRRACVAAGAMGDAARALDTERDYRKQVRKAYYKREEDFDTLREYNDYLEEVGRARRQA